MTVHEKLDYIMGIGLGNRVIDLGVGKNFDITNLVENYQSLTLANFICEPLNISLSKSSSASSYKYDVSVQATYTLSKKYDNETGIFTVTSSLYGKGYNSSCTAQATVTEDVHVYLSY